MGDFAVDHDQKVFDIVAQDEEKVYSDIITLSNGVQLKAGKVPPFILTEIDKRFPEPSVPKVYDEQRDRYYDNPNDPNYLKALTSLEQEKGFALSEVLVGYGTKIHYLPEGIESPEDTQWAEDAQVFIPNLVVPEKGRGRYLAWLKYYVIESGEDLMRLAQKVSAKIGVPEAEVGAAVARFQDNEGRRPDPVSGDKD
jgi:hypothetical protein